MYADSCLKFTHASLLLLSSGHQEKPNILAFHPQASSLLASAGYDGRLLVWNLDTQKVAITLEPLSEPVSITLYVMETCCPRGVSIPYQSLILFESIPSQLFAMAWSPDGKHLATVSKDHMIRIYEPRSSTHSVKEGAGPVGSRGARIVWLNDNHLVVSGFSR